MDLPRSIIEMLALAIGDAATRMTATGVRPIALVQQSIRPVVAEMCANINREIFVIGEREIEGIESIVFGEITSEQLSKLQQAAA